MNKFQELKLGHSHRYVIFKMNENNTSVIVDKVAAPNATYDDFVKELPKNDCRYGIYDFEYTIEGGARNKIVFVLW